MWHTCKGQQNLHVQVLKDVGRGELLLHTWPWGSLSLIIELKLSYRNWLKLLWNDEESEGGFLMRLHVFELEQHDDQSRRKNLVKCRLQHRWLSGSCSVHRNKNMYTQCLNILLKLNERQRYTNVATVAFTKRNILEKYFGEIFLKKYF